MQIKELKAKTKESDNKTPTPPNDPVDLSRWVQVTHNDPKPPKKQPDDPALAPTPIKEPVPNTVIGTDKPKRKSYGDPSFLSINSFDFWNYPPC